MSLTFTGPRGSFERRWIVYAMLRDNVQHHLEHGQPTPAFQHLHSLGQALSTGTFSVPALALRDELGRLASILELPIAELAISVRTQAVLTLLFPLPERSGTMLASDVGWELPFPLDGAMTLQDAFGSLVSELLRVTDGAVPADTLTVVDS
jgi:hypothetical protein